MSRVKPFPGFPRGVLRGSHFHAIARSIVYQQLATAAAGAIYGRVCALTPGGSFPSAAELLALGEERMRSAGLSRAKTRALRDLASRCETGQLELRGIGRLSNEEIIERLTTVWGVGEWTAQMFLIFKLGRLDVMPSTDLGIQEGLKRLDGLSTRPDPNHVLERAEPWRPLRSVASWVLWRLTDTAD
jgi:3-methyladenine DNA glycosylase/8-oxoguanine DNA glycosylase